MPSSSSAPSTSCVAMPPHSRSRVRNMTLSRAAAGEGHSSMRRRSAALTRSKYARPVGARARGLAPRSAIATQSVCVRHFSESPDGTAVVLLLAEGRLFFFDCAQKRVCVIILSLPTCLLESVLLAAAPWKTQQSRPRTALRSLSPRCYLRSGSPPSRLIKIMQRQRVATRTPTPTKQIMQL